MAKGKRSPAGTVLGLPTMAVAWAATLTVVIPKICPKVSDTGPLLDPAFFCTLTLTAGNCVASGTIPVDNKLAGVVVGVQVVSQYPVCTLAVRRAWVSALLDWTAAIAAVWAAAQAGVVVELIRASAPAKAPASAAFWSWFLTNIRCPRSTTMANSAKKATNRMMVIGATAPRSSLSKE